MILSKLHERFCKKLCLQQLEFVFDFPAYLSPLLVSSMEVTLVDLHDDEILYSGYCWSVFSGPTETDASLNITEHGSWIQQCEKQVLLDLSCRAVRHVLSVTSSACFVSFHTPRPEMFVNIGERRGGWDMPSCSCLPYSAPDFITASIT